MAMVFYSLVCSYYILGYYPGSRVWKHGATKATSRDGCSLMSSNSGEGHQGVTSILLHFLVSVTDKVTDITGSAGVVGTAWLVGWSKLTDRTEGVGGASGRTDIVVRAQLRRV